ncbi:MAG: hypothetical protein MUO31_00895 [Thermodesulfovibrionales bacterium]|nr:hypothetical protein [Thermodesulfovibrionales bacterium]
MAETVKNITTFDFRLLETFDKIFVLVSGGIDSTYLYEMIAPLFPEKTYAVNCWNPYEQSKTLNQMKQEFSYMEVRPVSHLDYKKILIKSFKLIPKAIEFRKKGKYEKKIFPCCKYIKHEEFKERELFKEFNTVVISGIKPGDGKQRGWFLKDLRNPPKNHNYASNPKKGFFHRHKEGQLYCYPFRDYFDRELPKKIIKQLRQKYPNLDHSGCTLCPVLVVFRDKIESKYTLESVKFYNKLINQQTLEVWQK